MKSISQVLLLMALLFGILLTASEATEDAGEGELAGEGVVAAEIPEVSPYDVVYICDSDSPEIVGAYKPNYEKLHGGVPRWENTQGGEEPLSLFNNHGFWYLGDFNGWPPKTIWRCVEVEGMTIDPLVY